MSVSFSWPSSSDYEWAWRYSFLYWPVFLFISYNFFSISFSPTSLSFYSSFSSSNSSNLFSKIFFYSLFFLYEIRSYWYCCSTFLTFSSYFFLSCTFYTSFYDNWALTWAKFFLSPSIDCLYWGRSSFSILLCFFTCYWSFLFYAFVNVSYFDFWESYYWSDFSGFISYSI